MGYYTRHEIQVKGDTNSEIDYEEEIENLSGYSGLFDGETVKWYDHEKNMRAYSKLHPDLLFRLDGEGEESGDIWIEYHQNGKMQRTQAKLMFDKFDESKLR